MAGKADNLCPYKWPFCQTNRDTMKPISKAACIGNRDFKNKVLLEKNMEKLSEWIEITEIISG